MTTELVLIKRLKRPLECQWWSCFGAIPPSLKMRRIVGFIPGRVKLKYKHSPPAVPIDIEQEFMLIQVFGRLVWRPVDLLAIE